MLLLLIVGGVGFAGRYHFVYGGPTANNNIKYVTLVKKEHWGFDDTFVSLNEVMRWDAATIERHQGTVRALLAAQWIEPADLQTLQREILAEQVENLSHDGFWCSGKSCSTTREACEAGRAQLSRATPECTTSKAWCYAAGNGKSCHTTRKECDAERVSQMQTSIRPTTGCVGSW